MKNSNVRLIARLANVSPATVSRYFNGHPYVSSMVKKKIENAIKQLNMNSTATEQTKMKKHSIGVGYIARKETLNYYSDILDELIACFHEQNLQTTMIQIRIDETNVKQLLRNYSNLFCIVLIGAVTPRNIIKDITEIGIPVILIDNEYPGVHSVNVDNFLGTYNSVKYLVQLNHKKIVFLGASKTRFSFKNRYMGYKKAMQEFGLDEIVEYYNEGDFYKEGIEMLENVITRKEYFSAIVTSGELINAGVMHVLSNYKLNVPKDISIIGFGNSVVSKTFFPALTSVSMMSHEISHWVSFLAKEILRGYKITSRTLISPELIIRDSCSEFKNYNKLSEIYKK